MNERQSLTSTGHPRDLWMRLAALLVLLYIGMMIVMFRSDLKAVFEPPLLLPIMNTIFAGLIPIAVSIIAARTYLYSGLNSFLFMGCGMMTFGCGAVLAGWLIGGSQGPNVNVTIYNLGALLGSVFHALSASIKFYNLKPDALPEWRKFKLILAYTGIIFFMFLLTVATLWGMTPKFFIQGVGPTILRQFVLGTAVVLFLLSGLIIMSIFTKKKRSFQYWYSLSLIMIALGLLAFFLQKSVGSPIGWLGRSGQYIGGIYALIAVLITFKSARIKGLSMQKAMAGLFRDAELSYHALVETVLDPIISFDPDGTIIQWNTASEKVFGYRQSEAVGSSLFDLVIDEAFSEMFRNELNNLRSVNDRLRVGTQLEITGKTKDGSGIPVEVSSSAMKASDQWSFVCVLRDITERKNAEAAIRKLNEDLERRVEERTEELRKSEERFHSYFMKSPVGINGFDSEGKVIAVNSIARQYFGVSEDDPLINYRLFEDPSISEETKGKIRNGQMVTEERFIDFQAIKEHRMYKTIKTEDDRVYIHLTYTPYGPISNPSGYIVIIQDVTERKHAEQELQAKNTELERFTYTVSHDLKSPLITIQYFTGQILQDLEAGRHDSAQDDLRKITAAASKMTDLLNDLLELSRIGRMKNSSEQIDMGRLVEDILEQLAGLLGQRQVEIVVQPDLPAVQGDQKRIAEVVQNLIENAIKYMGDQTAPRIEIGIKQDGKESIFFVSDNGIGVETQYAESIFGLFKKLDAKSEGTGIGLALVKRIIEIHGGRVWVESEGVGMGSRFCFTLPGDLWIKHSGGEYEPQHDR